MNNTHSNTNFFSLPAGLRLPGGTSKRLERPRPGIHTSITKRKQSGFTESETIPALGLAFPFYPSMWSSDQTAHALETALDLVKNSLPGRFTPGCINAETARLQKLFNRLNFQSLRKSIAIVMKDGEEKVFYLDFSVQPQVLAGNDINLVDLLHEMPMSPAFYIIQTTHTGFSIFSFCDGHLHRVLDDTSNTGVSLAKKMFTAISLINNGNERPVFITGTEAWVADTCFEEAACRHWFTVAQVGPYSEVQGMLQLAEIIVHKWRYWKERFLESQITGCFKNNLLAAGAGQVLEALKKSRDGLLLMDKKFSGTLKSSHTMPGDQYAKQLLFFLEKFFARGNHFETVSSRLLKRWNGVVLLGTKINSNDTPHPYHTCYLEGNNIY